MRLGILTKTFEDTTASATLQAARRTGYETVQYSMTNSGLDALPLVVEEKAAKDLRAASVETGVSVAAMTAVYNMIHPDIREREKGRKGIRTLAAASRTMGTRLLTMCTGTRDPENMWRFHAENASAPAWKDMMAEFEILIPIAEQYDVLLGVEPELANVISSAKKARQLLDTVGSRRVRIVFDAANLFDVADAARRRYTVEEAAELLGPSIEIAHAKDRTAEGKFCTAGKGVLDYRHYFATLRKAQFLGPMITHGLAASEAVWVADFLKKQSQV